MQKRGRPSTVDKHAWRIPGMGEPLGLPSMGSHRVRHHRTGLAHKHARDRKLDPHRAVVGCCPHSPPGSLTFPASGGMIKPSTIAAAPMVYS